MNIYLDIDGVLLANEHNAANYADEFLQAVLAAYPDSTYWLTTHNRRGENRTKEVLAPHLKPETVPLLDKIKPSVWNEMKTDGINFSEKFIWLDDDLWQDELKVLERHNATDNFILIDLQKNPNQLKDIAEII
ncbi:MAG: hypothetical protein EOT05_03320 [Candidatus Microsaccharimonas sossegonensis]|uniref:Uncharacterized protein n=1 Tax=Candidatus Microsaccharimonas sossegonensis TaxID=2506948 RepID=A0A4Q0AI03_9BACT|nr:MAG: hypothetical protein EOT05_03320 [Candidatus Microsaccharimonas sossegonensis]